MREKGNISVNIFLAFMRRYLLLVMDKFLTLNGLLTIYPVVIRRRELMFNRVQGMEVEITALVLASFYESHSYHYFIPIKFSSLTFKPGIDHSNLLIYH